MNSTYCFACKMSAKSFLLPALREDGIVALNSVSRYVLFCLFLLYFYVLRFSFFRMCQVQSDIKL